jgi:hypothetical protein
MIPIRGVRLPITDMLRQARRELGTGERLTGTVWFGKAQTQAPNKGRPRHYDYQEVAAVYVNAATAGRDPTHAVAKRYGLTRKSAGKLIGRLIKSNVLEPGGGWSATALPATVRAAASIPTPTVRTDSDARQTRKGKRR